MHLHAAIEHIKKCFELLLMKPIKICRNEYRPPILRRNKAHYLLPMTRSQIKDIEIKYLLSKALTDRIIILHITDAAQPVCYFFAASFHFGKYLHGIFLRKIPFSTLFPKNFLQNRYMHQNRLWRYHFSAKSTVFALYFSSKIQFFFQSPFHTRRSWRSSPHAHAARNKAKKA